MRMSESQVRIRLETLQWDIEYWEQNIKQFEDEEFEYRVAPPTEHSVYVWKRMVETLKQERQALYKKYGELLI